MNNEKITFRGYKPKPWQKPKKNWTKLITIQS